MITITINSIKLTNHPPHHQYHHPRAHIGTVCSTAKSLLSFFMNGSLAVSGAVKVGPVASFFAPWISAYNTYTHVIRAFRFML